MKARKANVGGKWVAIQRGLLKRPSWWLCRRELLWQLWPYRKDARLMPEKLIEKLA